jgi:chemotaxis protein MotA
MDYLNAPSIFIVLGGVIASTVIAYPLEQLKSLMKIMGNAFRAQKVDLMQDIDMVIEIANVARRQGILALEESVENMDDLFFKKGILLVVDGSDPELVRSIMETDLVFLKERHGSGQAILLQMSSFSPAYGMIGTLIGLINLLGNLNDMEALGPNMAVALVTTFYGVIFANLIFTPLAKKLKAQSDTEYLRKEILLEGILSIQNGENPRVIREKLNAFLSNTQVQIATARATESAPTPEDDFEADE